MNRLDQNRNTVTVFYHLIFSQCRPAEAVRGVCRNGEKKQPRERSRGRSFIAVRLSASPPELTRGIEPLTC